MFSSDIKIKETISKQPLAVEEHSLNSHFICVKMSKYKVIYALQ